MSSSPEPTAPHPARLAVLAGLLAPGIAVGACPLPLDSSLAGEGGGLMVQALSHAARGQRPAHGELLAVFVDEHGRLREDHRRNQRLDALALDPAIELLPGRDGALHLRRHFGEPGRVQASHHAQSALRPLWSAAKQLDALPLRQRAAGEPARRGRQLLTWLDLDLDGRVAADELRPLTAEGFGLDAQTPGSAWRLLDVESPAAARALLQRLRGGERRRYRLPPLAVAAPVIAGVPAEAYDLLYADAGYARFRAHYRQRRHVVYAASQAGLLHAFNAGFAEAGRQGFRRHGPAGETAHPLGAELWAFAPFELLPQLGALAARRPGAGFAASLRLFDARIFDDSARHPGGWGTLLVAGVRGELAPPRDHGDGIDALAADAAQWTAAFAPAYLVFDVTDPEAPPRLLASLKPPGLGDADGEPALLPMRGEQGDDWYLLFGNRRVEAGQAARLWLYDLRAGDYAPGWAPRIVAAAPHSRLGAAMVVDWDQDFRANAIYIGSSDGVGGGQLLHIDLDAAAPSPAAWAAPRTLLDLGRPLEQAPAVGHDASGQRWVLGVSGPADLATATAGPARIFAVIDSGLARSAAQLVDTSRLRMQADGRLHAGGADIEHERALLATVREAGGWRLDLAAGERPTAAPALLGDLLFVTTYRGRPCAEGGSRLWALHYRSGAPQPALPALGLDEKATGEAELRRVIPLGPGEVRALRLHPGALRDGRGASLLLPAADGSLQRQPLRLDAGAYSGEIDWRERRP